MRLEPLLPERCPLPRPSPRDEEGARGVLAEARTEERCPGELGDDQLLQLGGIDEHVVDGRRRIRVREMEGDAVIRPDCIHLEPERLAQAGRERERPRRVHPSPEGREDAEAPVADLVAEALDDDGSVRRDRARRLFLLAQVGEQVLRCALVQMSVGR